MQAPMNFWLLLVLWGPVAFVVCVLTAMFVLRRAKTRKYSVILFVGHVLYYIALAVYYLPQHHDAQAEIFWLIPAVVDLPSSILALLIVRGEFLSRILIMAVLGTVQYVLIGYGVDRLCALRQKKQSREADKSK